MDNNKKINGSKFVMIRGEEDDNDVRDVLGTFNNRQDAIKYRNEVFLEAQGYDPEEFNNPVAMKEIMKEMKNYVKEMKTNFVSNGIEYYEVVQVEEWLTPLEGPKTRASKKKKKVA